MERFEITYALVLTVTGSNANEAKESADRYTETLNMGAGYGLKKSELVYLHTAQDGRRIKVSK